MRLIRAVSQALIFLLPWRCNLCASKAFPASWALLARKLGTYPVLAQSRHGPTAGWPRIFYLVTLMNAMQVRVPMSADTETAQ